MIPVHIWAHRDFCSLTQFPEYFYEFSRGRGSIYNRPLIHTRLTRLNYLHVGEFANSIFSNRGKPSIHVFILSPQDLAPNLVLTSVCHAIMDAAWACPSVITLFLNVTKHENKLYSMNLLKVDQCHNVIEAYALLKPKKSLCIKPKHLYNEHVPQEKARRFDFQDLISLIKQVKIKDGEIKIIRNTFQRNDLNVPVGLE